MLSVLGWECIRDLLRLSSGNCLLLFVFLEALSREFREGSRPMELLYASDVIGRCSDFHYRRCLEGENGLFQSVLLKAVVIEPNVKLKCVTKFCYLGDTLGAGGGAERRRQESVFDVLGLCSRSYLLS